MKTFIQVTATIVFMLITTATFSGNDFHDLIIQGNFLQVKKELKRDTRLATMKDELGRTPLMLAVQSGNFALANFLVNKGAKVNANDNLKNYTPLHYAVLYNHCRIIKYLLSRRADVTAQDNEGNFPIHIAAANGCSKAVKLLLIHRAEVNSMNHYWQTPLHLAARGTINKKEFPYALSKTSNYLEVAELLLESGAFYQLKDVNQNMPATIVVKHWHDTDFAARFLKLIKKHKK